VDRRTGERDLHARTALLLAGLCTGLFAAVAAIGLAISMLFEDENAGMMRGVNSRTKNRGP